MFNKKTTVLFLAPRLHKLRYPRVKTGMVAHGEWGLKAQLKKGEGGVFSRNARTVRLINRFVMFHSLMGMLV